jgi:hypothetical protein
VGVISASAVRETLADPGAPVANRDPKCAPSSGLPVLTAFRKTPWLRAYDEALIARGKLPKVALIAAMRKLPPPTAALRIGARSCPDRFGEGARP